LTVLSGQPILPLGEAQTVDVSGEVSDERQGHGKECGSHDRTLAVSVLYEREPRSAG
jgi:hypothetical protein